ncbi:MAG: phosphate acyltransferase PlsX [Bacteroidetes bacterium]|jgi:glycerol-3-phosphate acyltransferase PlsX|nr:phosphate acyltransferase PlsX [Bacteroidota bacterium]
MRIGIDIMGGDYAPTAVLDGINLVYDMIGNSAELVLVGDRDIAHTYFKKKQINTNRFELVHAPEVIGMGEHPTKTFSQKPNSSIAVGYRLLAEKKIDGFASAGNTGAMFVAAMHTIKSIPGIIRPCLGAFIPKTNGHTLILDVGLNPDCKPDVLYQYAILGSYYTQYVYNVPNPRIGLLNLGAEEEKGNILTRATYQIMKGTTDFNFIGNVEGNDFFKDEVDVVVCDGFVGNVLLKQAEAFYTQIKKRKIQDEFFDLFNFENYGGTPILGVNAPAIIGHGISNQIAIKNMILHTIDVTNSKLTEKIKEVFQ